MAYSSPLILIIRKVRKDNKQFVIQTFDFRTAKNNLVIRFSRYYHFWLLEDSLRLSKFNKKFYHIFGSALYLQQRIPMGLNISPSILPSSINTILDHLQSGKCDTIMNDLLLFIPTKKLHSAKLEDIWKALLQNGLKYLQRISGTQGRITINGKHYFN